MESCLIDFSITNLVDFSITSLVDFSITNLVDFSITSSVDFSITNFVSGDIIFCTRWRSEESCLSIYSHPEIVKVLTGATVKFGMRLVSTESREIIV